jgi:hypothetical protein
MKLKDNYCLAERDLVYMVDKYRQCREIYSLHLTDIFQRDVKTVAAGYSETSVPIYHAHGATSLPPKKKIVFIFTTENLKSGIKFFVLKMS